MSKIGSYEYPDTQFKTLLRAVEVLVDKFEGKVNDEKTFAMAIGHTTNKSGGYLRKVADLRRYGLIESRGIEATERAKMIARPLSADERDRALNDAIMEIKLWNVLQKRFGYEMPPMGEFKIHLAEVTGDRDKAVRDADKISNIYKDAMSLYNEITVKKVSKDSKIIDIESEREEKPDVGEEKVPETLMVFKSGDVNLTLPRTDPNIDIICNVLDGMKKQKERKDQK